MTSLMTAEHPPHTGLVSATEAMDALGSIPGVAHGIRANHMRMVVRPTTEFLSLEEFSSLTEWLCTGTDGATEVMFTDLYSFFSAWQR